MLKKRCQTCLWRCKATSKIHQQQQTTNNNMKLARWLTGQVRGTAVTSMVIITKCMDGISAFILLRKSPYFIFRYSFMSPKTLYFLLMQGWNSNIFTFPMWMAPQSVIYWQDSSNAGKITSVGPERIATRARSGLRASSLTLQSVSLHQARYMNQIIFTFFLYSCIFLSILPKICQYCYTCIKKTVMGLKLLIKGHEDTGRAFLLHLNSSSLPLTPC